MDADAFARLRERLAAVREFDIDKLKAENAERAPAARANIAAQLASAEESGDQTRAAALRELLKQFDAAFSSGDD